MTTKHDYAIFLKVDGGWQQFAITDEREAKRIYCQAKPGTIAVMDMQTGKRCTYDDYRK